jgi:hypothetical protein
MRSPGTSRATNAWGRGTEAALRRTPSAAAAAANSDESGVVPSRASSGERMRPWMSLRGLSFKTPGNDGMHPVRIFGPGRSIKTKGGGCPGCAAARAWSIIFFQVGGSSWAQLTRTTSQPLATRLRRREGSFAAEDGRVTITRTRREGGWGPRTSSALRSMSLRPSTNSRRASEGLKQFGNGCAA